MSDPEIPEAACPHCGYKSDRASEIRGSGHVRSAVPEPGDFTLCFGCAGVLKFGPDLTLVAMSDDEVRKALLRLPRLHRARVTLVRYKKEHAR